MDDLKPCPTETFKTSDGITVTVDAADLHHVAHFNWRMSSGDRYIRAWCADRGKMIAMHRLILGFPDGKSIDHINGDPTDNRRGYSRRMGSRTTRTIGGTTMTDAPERNITWQERAGMAILIAMALAGVWVIAWGMGL